jgi:hypothetical protein
VNILKAIGYTFLGIGTVFLILACIIFLSVSFMTHQVFGAAWATVGLAAGAPWWVLSAICYVIGTVGYYAGQENVAALGAVKLKIGTPDSIMQRIDRLENIVDKNFGVVTARLDELEETQKLAAQNTIVKARKD